MKTQVNFKVINNDYDKDYAEMYNWGEEGEGNWKFHSAWKYEVDKVASSQIIKNTSTLVNLNDINNDSFVIELTNLECFKCKLENGEIEEFFVSESLIDKVWKNSHSNSVERFYFFIKDGQPFHRITDTIFINQNEMPKELFEKEWKSIKPASPIKSKLIELRGKISSQSKL